MDDNIKNIIASSIAGMTSLFFIFPAEVVKNNYQFLKNKNQTYSTVINNIYKQNGFMGFYRGIAAPMCIHPPRFAAILSINEYLKNRLPKNNYTGYMTGAMSGVIAGTMITTPGENIKVFSIHNNTPIIKSLIRMYSERGLSAFTKGMGAIVLKESATFSSRLGTTEYLNKLLKPKTTLEVSLIGGISCAAITLFTMPFDVLVVRLQSDYTKNYTSIYHCIKTLIKNEGICILFRGTTVRMTRTFVGMFVMFGTYDFIKKMLENY